MNQEEKDVFLKRFPLLTFEKGEDTSIKHVRVYGVKNHLTGRSSHTSPLRRNSHYFEDERLNLMMFKNSPFTLTIVDIPPISVSTADVLEHGPFLCGLVQETDKQLTLINYAHIPLTRALIFGVDFPQWTSERETEVFVNLDSGKSDSMHTKMFSFVWHSTDKRHIKMTRYFKITSWSQEKKNTKKGVSEDINCTLDRERLYLDIVDTIYEMREDREFLTRTRELLQNDKIKNRQLDGNHSAK
jgi:hypothetical protein